MNPGLLFLWDILYNILYPDRLSEKPKQQIFHIFFIPIDCLWIISSTII